MICVESGPGGAGVVPVQGLESQGLQYWVTVVFLFSNPRDVKNNGRYPVTNSQSLGVVPLTGFLPAVTRHVAAGAPL